MLRKNSWSSIFIPKNLTCRNWIQLKNDLNRQSWRMLCLAAFLRGCYTTRLQLTWSKIIGENLYVKGSQLCYDVIFSSIFLSFDLACVKTMLLPIDGMLNTLHSLFGQHEKKSLHDNQSISHLRITSSIEPQIELLHSIVMVNVVSIVCTF